MKTIRKQIENAENKPRNYNYFKMPYFSNVLLLSLPTQILNRLRHKIVFSLSIMRFGVERERKNQIE